MSYSRKIIVTCAVTGANSAVLSKHPAIPKTPEEIAAAALEAARAGASIVHIHVRDPKTGLASNELNLYSEAVERIRASSTDVVINLTCGMDGEITFDSLDPIKLGAGTTLKTPKLRVQQALHLKPEIASLDCGTIGFTGDRIFVVRMSDLREMAALLREAGVKPELECFELGHIENAKRLIAENLIEGPPLFQLCLGTGASAPATPLVVEVMRSQLPSEAIWAAFGCGIDEMPMVAQVVNSGGHVRVGLEDNIWLRKGVLASNSDLVANAVDIIRKLGCEPATPAEARQMLNLLKR